MQLGGQQASGNVEDRRGMGVGGGLGIGGVVVAVIAYFLGFDPGTAINVAQQVTNPRTESQEVRKGAPTDTTGQFAAKVLGSTEAVWGKILQQANSQYRPPTLVLYEGQVRSACGTGQSAMGPFYCGNDQKLYLDLSFFRDMQARLKASGDFAQAYVIAHEVGHHIQNLTGTLQKLEGQRGSAKGATGTAVRVELQADCYAGVWGHHAGNMKQLDAGDIEEGLGAASAIGDDRLQKQSQGRVVPESFTHGTSEQRMRWFKRGLDSGNPKDCNTFAAGSL